MSEQKFIEIAQKAEDLKNEIGKSIDTLGSYEVRDGIGNVEEINVDSVEGRIEILKEDVKNLKKLQKQQKKLQKLELKKERVMREFDRERGSRHHRGRDKRHK